MLMFPSTINLEIYSKQSFEQIDRSKHISNIFNPNICTFDSVQGRQSYTHFTHMCKKILRNNSTKLKI